VCDHAGVPGRWRRFDADEFVAACLAAARGASPLDSVRELLTAVVADRAGIERQLGTRVGADLGILHASPELVVQHVIFPIGYSTGLHEHRLWTLSAVYAGCEQHDLHRVVGSSLHPVGIEESHAGDARVLAPDVAHSSTATGDEHLRVLHVYLGDLFSTGAGEWDTPDGQRREYSDAWMNRLFDSLATAGLLSTSETT
jgi:predicted metal-dependent enzyme (double-stranded beta helix superfamily)